MSGSQQPQGQQNAPSAFGFKPADTSNATSSNPTGGFSGFGSTPSAFGGTNTAPNNATNIAMAPKVGDGGFGSATNASQGVQQPSSAASSGGIFGSSSGTQTGNLFGNAPKFGTSGGSLPTGATTSNPLFGVTAAQSITPSTTLSPAFGGTTGAAPTSTGGAFGSVLSNQPPQIATTSGSAGSNNLPTSGTSFFGNASSKASSGGLFGSTGANNAPTTANNPQPVLSIFGASNNNQPTSTQLPGSTGTLNTSTTPSASNPLFPNAPSSTTAVTPGAQPSPFGSFGSKPVDTSSQPGTSTAVPTSGQTPLQSLFGSNNTATKPSTSTPLVNAAPSTTPSSGLPSLFANLPKKPETAPVPGATPAPPSAFSGFANLAAQKDTGKDGDKDAIPAATGPKDSSKDAVPSKDPAPSPFAGFNLGANKDASTSKPAATPGDAGATATATASGPGATAPAVPSVPAPSMLRGKTVEDIVNRWTTELEAHTREFSQFASEVAVWDRTLIENGSYISALYATVLAAESTQTSLDQSLDHVEQQQRHLAATLDQYEKYAGEILHGPGGIMTSTEGLGLADSERDKSYAVAANLYTQLDDLSRSLTQMVEAVNGLNLSPGGSHGTEDPSQEDAISTIAGILHAHLSSLQWIDGALNEMEGKVKDAERKIKDSNARGGTRRDGMNKSRGYGLGSPGG